MYAGNVGCMHLCTREYRMYAGNVGCMHLCTRQDRMYAVQGVTVAVKDRCK